MNSSTEKRLIAIDPSLTTSGWALFSLTAGNLLAFGVVEPPGPAYALAKRLDDLQTQVTELFQTVSMRAEDVLVCEGPGQLVLNPQSSLKVEQVRSIFESVARAHALEVPGRLNPRTVQSELLGMRGKQLKREAVKEWARQTVERLYPKELSELPCLGLTRRVQVVPQDCIDAILIGTLAMTKIKQAWRTNTDTSAAFRERMHVSRARRGRAALRFASIPKRRFKQGNS